MTYHDLNVEVLGSTTASPVLLLHGWGSSGQNLRPVAQALSDEYEAHVIDLPGHGRSPSPPTAWGVPEHADLLHNYIKQELGGATSIIGHSNGGRIALYMASNPSMTHAVTRLALISPSGIEPDRSLGYHLRSTLSTVLKAPFTVLPSSLRSPALDWLRHSLVWRMIGSSDYNTLQGVMRETFVKTVNYYVDDDLHRITAPVLLFWGTDDEAVSRRQMSIIEDEVEDCGLVELDGAGHYGHIDAFSTVVAGIRHFLEHSELDTAHPSSP